MKVNIGKYKDWFGPYQLAEMILFWIRPEVDDYGLKKTSEKVDKLGDWLANDKNGNPSWISKILRYIDSKNKRKVQVRIDDYDVWDMSHTLGLIALPMLKKLKEEKHGSCLVDDKDVPEDIRGDEFIHEKWAWALDEMIFAFECKSGDFQIWEDEMIDEIRDKDGKRDEVAYARFIKKSERIQNGFRLFGAYYEGLWD